MPWARLDESAMDHPKVSALADGAFRLWVQGLVYCQRFLTDGYISDVALRGQRAYSPKRKAELLTVGLWEQSETGVRVHDYLDWNESREHVSEARRFARVRMALVRDPELRRAIQARDGNACRYCGQPVNWLDRKGPRGATYDHVVPGGGDDLTNLVVSCRGCNSRKGQRTPEQAGLVLLDPNQKYPDRHLDKSSTNTTPRHTTPPTSERRERAPRAAALEPTEARSKRPIFTSSRFVVFEWMLDDLRKLLGLHFEDFDVHAWFFDLAERADREGLVVPQRDGGKWLYAQTEAEAARRGLIVSSARTGSTKTAGNLANLARFAQGGSR